MPRRSVLPPQKGAVRGFGTINYVEVSVELEDALPRRGAFVENMRRTKAESLAAMEAPVDVVSARHSKAFFSIRIGEQALHEVAKGAEIGLAALLSPAIGFRGVGRLQLFEQRFTVELDRPSSGFELLQKVRDAVSEGAIRNDERLARLRRQLSPPFRIEREHLRILDYAFVGIRRLSDKKPGELSQTLVPRRITVRTNGHLWPLNHGWMKGKRNLVGRSSRKERVSADGGVAEHRDVQRVGARRYARKSKPSFIVRDGADHRRRNEHMGIGQRPAGLRVVDLPGHGGIPTGAGLSGDRDRRSGDEHGTESPCERHPEKGCELLNDASAQKHIST